MLRFAIVLLAAVAASGTAESADQSIARRGWHRAVILPAGLPRPHYRFRTTISYNAPVPRLSVYENPRNLYAPGYADVAYIRPAIALPLLPGPYYASPYVIYWDRLPYSCDFYGYC
jgi:hypothetical protein